MRVAVLAVDGMFDSGLTSVLDTLTTANHLHSEVGLTAPPFDVTVVGRSRRVRTAHGLTVPTMPWRDLTASPPDVLVMPSIGIRRPDAVVDVVRHHPALQNIAAWCADGIGMAAACSGTFFLAEAGVLDGLRATTCWWLADTFRSRYPRVDLDETQVVVHDNVTTAGVGYAHVDLTLSLVTSVSPALSDRVAAYLLAGRRDTQIRAVTSVAGHTIPPLVIAFERHVRQHLHEGLSIRDIAFAIGTSERTLQRTVSDTLGVSPTRYLQELRLTQATHLLTTTDRSTAAVAESVGYRSADTLRALLRRNRGQRIRDVRPNRTRPQ